MKKYCQWCRRRLRRRDMRCPYCRDPAVNWQHATALAVGAAAVIFFLMRAF
jgi:RNA polymerase subunit RPABC4/transcription elongation factor Spt4